ncbi:MAG: 4-hydroxy-tetrahydrodipicolinate reductase [Bacteroidales bacterium]|jgi:4-hydroxy-tetrahydrodipicolinate reductase|nr:4-hydroxy-tetrahydrodipicolinate reductase [Bacteroidales bacterium]
MNILLIGYGKMGRMVEKAALMRHHKIVHIIDNEDNWKDLDYEKVDVAIDFSTPYVVEDNIIRCFNHFIPIVVGTTNWYSKLNDFKLLAQKEERTLFVASNFSIGMFIFNRINILLAKIMNNEPSYEVSIEEIHHKHKLDAPSGSAITLAENIIDNIDRKDKWVLDAFEAKSDEVNIFSRRIGEVVGEHSVLYSSVIDDIKLTHSAHSREGFALGAVLAAEFLKDKKGYFTMKDLVKV